MESYIFVIAMIALFAFGITKFVYALVNNCVGFGLSPFYGTQKVVVYDYLM